MEEFLKKRTKLLVDYSNIMYGIYFLDIQREEIDIQKQENENFVRHLFLNKLMAIKRKLEIHPENIILCVDHKMNWRRKVFPLYKESRARARRESDIDFDAFFKLMDDFYHELVDFFPFITLRNEYVEADDFIAILTQHYSAPERDEPVIIVSTDQDFHQLQKYKNVLYQYDHIKMHQVKIQDPEQDLLMKVLCGDPGDGVPNILSDDDTFVTDGKRQKPLGEKKAMALILSGNLEKFLEENNLVKNYKRNDRLINFDKIPDEIKRVVHEKLFMYKTKRDRLMLEAYFQKKQLKSMQARIPEFFK